MDVSVASVISSPAANKDFILAQIRTLCVATFQGIHDTCGESLDHVRVVLNVTRPCRADGCFPMHIAGEDLDDSINIATDYLHMLSCYTDGDAEILVDVSLPHVASDVAHSVARCVEGRPELSRLVEAGVFHSVSVKVVATDNVVFEHIACDSRPSTPGVPMSPDLLAAHLVTSFNVMSRMQGTSTLFTRYYKSASVQVIVDDRFSVKVTDTYGGDAAACGEGVMCTRTIAHTTQDGKTQAVSMSVAVARTEEQKQEANRVSLAAFRALRGALCGDHAYVRASISLDLNDAGRAMATSADAIGAYVMAICDMGQTLPMAHPARPVRRGERERGG